MTQSNLGRLEQVDLRSIWANESSDFTPWLAQEDNLRLLGETIGIDLELEAQEQSVGPFSADIFCKDVSDNSWVLIENQLEKTDHVHLGQLLTYAAGLQAVTIIWISQRFTDEHRAALDWLNEITDERFRFFGLEIEAWKIGSSNIAPKFNIISKPNDWVTNILRKTSLMTRGELTDAKKLQLEFWTAFAAHCSGTFTGFRVTKPLPQSWMNLGVGRSGFNVTAVAALWDSLNNNLESHEIRAELYIGSINAKVHFEVLENNRSEIETALNRKLTWHNSENARSCRLYTRKSADLNDRTHWPEYFEWLVTELNDFHQVFSPMVKSLEP